MPDSFIDHLLKWRDRYGLTQEDAAKLLGIPYRTYQGWEAGRGPAHESLVRWAIHGVAKTLRPK